MVRSPIRTDADQIIYNLQGAIRSKRQLDLRKGKLAVQDLPEAENQRHQSDLGIKPKSDREGVMPDVHWHSGLFGGKFPEYTLTDDR